MIDPVVKPDASPAVHSGSRRSRWSPSTGALLSW